MQKIAIIWKGHVSLTIVGKADYYLIKISKQEHIVLRKEFPEDHVEDGDLND